ncbi:uncharacterized protein LOC126780570 isoform X2 [Nymphalis io]|uniref:uncharacterized protein LOC126780570 isoform X2 n=1 Tax=Inachis io TaxID=171585 RepID=UPI0021683764|nr:uncharacterized protein LOC126780570 isoform X2 [Nymphalis io]
MARLLLEVKEEFSDDDSFTATSNSSATSSDSEETKKFDEHPTMERLQRVFHQLDDIVKPTTPERREYLRSKINDLVNSIDSHDCQEEKTRTEEWTRENQEFQSNQERESTGYGFVPKYREPRRWIPKFTQNPRNEDDIKTFADREAAVNKIYDLVKDLDNVIYRKPNIRVNRLPTHINSRYVSTSSASSTSSRSRRDKRRRNYTPASVLIHCSKCKTLNRHITYLRNGNKDEI